MKNWLILPVMMIISCTGIKKAVDTDIETITFGSGGGVTGAVNVFVLRQDGTLVKESRKGRESAGTIGPEKTADLFKKADAIKNYRYHKPGNMYSFIELAGPSGKNNITWGLPVDVDTTVLQLYKELNLLLRAAE